LRCAYFRSRLCRHRRRGQWYVAVDNLPQHFRRDKLRARRKRRAGAAVIIVPAGGLVQNTTSLATGNPIAAQIVFDGATSANLSYLVVDGSNNNIQTCGLNLIGIYDRNSSGTITKNSLLNQTLPSGFTGCPSGLGIFVQSGDAGTSKSPSPGTSRAQMSPSRATP
jgi:hypothetical protein